MLMNQAGIATFITDGSFPRVAAWWKALEEVDGWKVLNARR